MSRKTGLTALVDSGFWMAILEDKDQHHAAAQECAEIVLDSRLILPWPTLYETLRTRLMRRPTAIKNFERIIKRPNTVLLDDSSYRESALEMALSIAGKRFSLVDNVLRLIMEDINIPVDCLFTFNGRDFHDVCAQRQIEIVPDEERN